MALGSCRHIRRCPFFWILYEAQLYVQYGNVICLGVPEGLQGVLVLAGVLQGHRRAVLDLLS